MAGDVLKVMPPGEVGAQWVDGLANSAQKLAQWSGGHVLAFSYQRGAGRVYYQADLSPELAGQQGYNGLLALLSAGIGLVAQSQPSQTSTQTQASYSTTTVVTTLQIGSTSTTTQLVIVLPVTNAQPETTWGLTGTQWTALSTVLAVFSVLIASIAVRRQKRK
jgi:hypothetical protein